MESEKFPPAECGGEGVRGVPPEGEPLQGGSLPIIREELGLRD